MRRNNVGRYAIWQLRDFLIDRGLAMALIGALICAPPVIEARRFVPPDPTAMLLKLVGGLGVLFALISINAIVSNDRTTGYFRFIFSKPVSPAVFYTQQFGVYLVGLMITTSVLIGMFAMFMGPVSPWGSLEYVALMFVAFGGPGFLISTVTRRDWVILIAVWAGTQILYAPMWYRPDAWTAKLLWILPPVQRLEDAGRALITRGPVSHADIAWILGYSAVCFALGVLVLRRRPFHS